MSACRNVSRLPRGCPARAGGRGAISAPPLSPDPGQVESVHHWLLKRRAADGDLSPFALSLCCQGSKALRAQPRPFSVPVVAHATCRGTAGVLLPPARGGVLALSGQMERGGLLHPAGSLLRSCVHMVSMPCRVWYQRFQL